jgi:hypothetical protein
MTAQAAAKVIRASSSAALERAIREAESGDSIELQGGVYPSPRNGFHLSNLKKALTLRAAPGAAVVLDGGGERPLVRLENGQPSRGKRIVFQDLAFANGVSDEKSAAGGVTMRAAKARFVRCTFAANRNTSAGGAGALRLAEGSDALLIASRFLGNSSRSRGGAIETIDSTFEMRGGDLQDNGTNRAGHATKAVGGAAYILDSKATFRDVFFARNGSGWVAGALFVYGHWGGEGDRAATEVLIERSTFEDNGAQPFPGQQTGRNEGGAIHAEDDAEVRIRRSVFVRNHAQVGGALHSYRAAFEVEDSIFLDNRARQDPGEPSVGGTIASDSNDQRGPSTGGGAVNRPSAALAVRRSLVRGPIGSAGARTGGCLYVVGDLSRQYGTGSVPKQGTLEDNRATLLIEDSVLAHCAAGASGLPLGGALYGSLVDLRVVDSLVFENRAPEPGGGGGGFALFDETSAAVATTTFAANLAERFGGAIFLGGSRLEAHANRFLRNALRPAAAATLSESRGAAIYSLPRASGGSHGPADVRGAVAGSLFSSSAGLALWDVEPVDDTAINDLRYQGNRFFESSFGTDVYMLQRDFVARTPAELNALVVERTSRPPTDKSTVPNATIGPPAEAALLAVQEAGAAPARYGPFLAFAWDGGGATLDGAPLASRQGLVADPVPGLHSLAVPGAGTVTVAID